MVGLNHIPARSRTEFWRPRIDQRPPERFTPFTTTAVHEMCVPRKSTGSLFKFMEMLPPIFNLTHIFVGCVAPPCLRRASPLMLPCSGISSLPLLAGFYWSSVRSSVRPRRYSIRKSAQQILSLAVPFQRGALPLPLPLPLRNRRRQRPLAFSWPHWRE